MTETAQSEDLEPMEVGRYVHEALRRRRSSNMGVKCAKTVIVCGNENMLGRLVLSQDGVPIWNPHIATVGLRKTMWQRRTTMLQTDPIQS